MFGLPTWAVTAVLYLVIAITIFGTGMKTMSMLDAGQIAKYQAAQAKETAVLKQVTAVTTLVTKDDQTKELMAQAALATKAKVITKEITHYVSSNPAAPVGCVTWGMLRLHDAAVLGVDPSSLLPPAGQSDDACSPVAPSVFMATVVGNYASAEANAEQLNAVIADVKARSAAVATASKP